MAKTIAQAFETYKQNLNITDRQTMLIAQRRTAVVGALQSKLSLHSAQRSLLIGSHDRNTMTRYLSEADVDVMVILHHSNNVQWDTSDGTIAALDKFRTILDDAYPNISKRRDQNCITMKYPEFRLDVVPAFRYVSGNNTYYRIPDSVRKIWVSTDPVLFAKLITEVNKNMDDTFIPIIKMIKGWNRNVGWPIRSFHLECVLYEHYKNYKQRYTYPSTLKVFFESLPSYLSNECHDPVMLDRVDTYLDNSAAMTKRQVAIAAAKRAASVALEAYNDQEQYPAVAIGEWKQLFGEFFPAYG